LIAPPWPASTLQTRSLSLTVAASPTLRGDEAVDRRRRCPDKPGGSVVVTATPVAVSVVSLFAYWRTKNAWPRVSVTLGVQVEPSVE